MQELNLEGLTREGKRARPATPVLEGGWRCADRWFFGDGYALAEDFESDASGSPDYSLINS